MANWGVHEEQQLDKIKFHMEEASKLMKNLLQNGYGLQLIFNQIDKPNTSIHEISKTFKSIDIKVDV